MATRPLDGITVVSLEQAVAAPFCSRQLADLGARVIKIERPRVGDFARDYDQTVKGLSSHFVWLNRSKESLALDVKHAAAKEIQRGICGSRIQMVTTAQLTNDQNPPSPSTVAIYPAADSGVKCQRATTIQ